MVGAPLIVARAALRIGAGLVTIAAPIEVAEKLERRVEEVMTMGLDSNSGKVITQLSNFIEEHKIKSIVIGPGLKQDSAQFIRDFLPRIKLPAVLDAGAINALGHHLNLLEAIAQKNPNLILTPHAGEFDRLIGQTAPVNQQTIEQFAQKYRVTLIYKGSHSLVAHPNGDIYINQTGNVGLAKAGTGDVLSGMIGGLLAQGVDVFKTSEAGVYLHGLAGDLAAASKTQAGMIASDVVESIPAAIKKVCE